jgi:hypothetical protein
VTKPLDEKNEKPAIIDHIKIKCFESFWFLDSEAFNEEFLTSIYKKKSNEK